MAELLIATLSYGGVQVDVYAEQLGDDVRLHIKLVNGVGDLNGLFIDYNNDGGSIFYIGTKSNNMNGSDAEGTKLDGFDFGAVLGTVGAWDANYTEGYITLFGISLAELDGAQIGVRVTSTIDGGSLKLSAIVDAPTGPVDDGDATVTITGTPQEDSVLTANFGDDDPDGAATGITYQWYRDGATIFGATGLTYTLGDDDVGATLTVKVSYTDGQGFAETIESQPSGVVTNVNDAPIAVADTNAGDAVVESGVLPGQTQLFAGDPSATGNVLINDTDVDVGDTKMVIGVVAGVSGGPVAGNVGATITGIYGSLALAVNGAWSYTLDNADPDTNALAQGQAASDVFSYTMADSQGAISTTTLTINITGTADPRPILSFAPAGSVFVSEAAGTVDFVASLSNASDAPITVTYLAQSITAEGGNYPGRDFIGMEYQSITFSPGETSQTISVALIDDSISEPNETFRLYLQSLNGPVGYNGGNEIAVVTIVDNDNHAPIAVADNTGNNELLNSIETIVGGEDADTLEGDNLNNILDGGGGNDVLTGGAGNDTLIGGEGDDLLVFAPGSGADTVVGFVAGAGTPDKLDLSAFGFLDFAAVLAAADDSGGTGPTVIDLGGGDSITLIGVQIAQLDQDDFFIRSA